MEVLYGMLFESKGKARKKKLSPFAFLIFWSLVVAAAGLAGLYFK